MVCADHSKSSASQTKIATSQSSAWKTAANGHFIAYTAAKLTKEPGAKVIATFLDGRAGQYVEPILNLLDIPAFNCNVEHKGLRKAVVEIPTQW